MGYFALIISVVGFLLINTPLAGQDYAACHGKYDSTQQKVIYTKVDQMPLFPGGHDSLMSFIIKNLDYPQHPPKEAKVYAAFTIERSGSVSNLLIFKGVEERLDNEVLRMLEKMPPWTAGSCDGELVPVQITIPINFKLVD